ncbi:MAG: c-type cytochrome [Chloroflexi bacterium]|nr:c-type cytochrome [Chloroflexota bacterium]
MKGRKAYLLALIIGALLLGGCSADKPRISFDELDFALADAGSGEKLFNQSNNEAPACSTCHSVTGEQSSIGNSLAGLAETAGSRVGGQSAEEYLYWSILRPGRYLVTGYSNIMFADYEDRLEAPDLADLIAYLGTLD